MKEEIDYSTCLCGSGLPYKDCCQGKLDPTNEKLHKALMQEFNKKRGSYKKICLHPLKSDCYQQKIGAHTISRKSVLTLISRNNKVLMPVLRGINNELKMEALGIKSDATKLNCFCKLHDEMFHPIDMLNVELSEKNIFLYAYRAFAGTYYKTMREVSIHEDLSQKYDFTLMPQTIFLQESMKRWIVELDDCRKIFDDAIIHQNYSVLDSLCYTLPYSVSFAVSSCFPVVFDVYGSPIPHKDDLMQMVYISVIPDKEESKIIFSWLKRDSSIYATFKRQLDIVPKHFFAKYLNNLLPLSCENMVVSPDLWDSWSTDTQNEFIYKAHYGWYLRRTPASYFTETEYDLFEDINKKDDFIVGP